MISSLGRWFVLANLALVGCSTLLSRRPEEPALPAVFVGPPEPAQVMGPARQEPREVAVYLGPGMAAALGGAGVLKALAEQGIRVVRVGGAEFGAFVAAAYAVGTTPNGIDMKLMRFRRGWVEPRSGLYGMLSGGKLPATELRSGLRQIFREEKREKTRIPLSVYPEATATDGTLAGEVCAAMTDYSWQEPCLGEVRHNEPTPDGTAAFKESILSAGVAVPIVWVVSGSGDFPGIRDAEREVGAAAEQARGRVRDLADSRDLILELNPAPAGRSFDFEKRSDILFEGRKAARTALLPWLARLGWASGGRSP